MKIIITGSLGHISKPLTLSLVEKGHSVTVISSSTERKQEIEDLDATAAIGSIADVEFLTKTFSGADAVYTMVPPGNYTDHNFDLHAYFINQGSAYAAALKASGVRRVVNLSTIGGNLAKGNGILAGAHEVEKILNELPSDVTVTHMRPNSFYYNLLGYVPVIKSMGFIAANYGGEGIIPWVAPADIAAAIAEELTAVSTGRKIRRVGSEDLSGNETARILGEAIGKPDLKWIVLSDEEALQNLITVGLNPTIAAGLIEMYSALRTGLLAEDYYNNKPAMGKVKMTDYATEFALAYHQ
ncbi:NAD(P)H-binding protein [Pedobacter aquatilis]|uniref:NmrA family NAD(P)-binding protein n=1 Tax=Pedobacter aquatilis TaxID=351343 RepID=UPI00292FE245|nr:NAD(P)H-binding protein [Pedobacter aquatilis]